MSATRFRKPAVRQPEAPPGGAPRAHSISTSRWLALAALLAVGWSAALFLMDLTTANPRLVSRDQILASDAVIIGRIARPGEAMVKVERVFFGDLAEGDELRVVNLSEIPAMADGEGHVLPLSAFRNDFAVTTLDGQKAPPLVYDRSPETIDAVKAILRDHL
jgi:hypothetical protein